VGSLAEGRRQRAARIAVIAGIADIARSENQEPLTTKDTKERKGDLVIARDRKKQEPLPLIKTDNTDRHKAGNAETHGMTWDDSGWGGALSNRFPLWDEMQGKLHVFPHFGI